MRKRLVSLIVALLVYSQISTVAYAVNPDYSLWDKFIKYDLCITDYDALTDEEKELCKFIFETEQSSNGTVICERARRTIAGDTHIGDRITLEQLEDAYGIWDVYSENKVGWYSYINCVPDIRVIDKNFGQNEYWLDDEGTAKVVFTGDIGSAPEFDSFEIYENDKYSCSIKAAEMPFGKPEVKLPYNENDISLDFSQAIEYNGDYYYITPYNEAVLLKSGICAENPQSVPEAITEPHIIPDKINDCPVVAIEEYAFAFAPYAEIVLPETMKYIDTYAFYQCSHLQKINFPASLEFIGVSAFNSTAIAEVNIDNPYLVISSSAFSDYYLTDININVRKIGRKVFGGCENLKNVTLGDSVEIIDNLAFFCCPSIENLIIPSSVKAIGQGAFAGDEIYGKKYCDGIKSITIPSTVEIIGIVPEQKGSPFTSGIYYPPTFPLTDEPLSVFDSDCVINGWYDTEAHSYALENNLAFVALNEDIAYGDTNKDGSVGISDAVLLQQFLVGQEYLSGYEADVNKDGRINVFDANTLKRELITF